MKIRLVSDLHVDVNKQGNFGFRYQEQDILLIAGDIAGSYSKELQWFEGLSKDITCPVFAVAGNHLGYDYKLSPYSYFGDYPKVGTKQWSIDFIKCHCPENIHYLDNDYVDIGEYIIYGGCMYSDYKLYPNKEISQRAGEQYLNDFRYVYVQDKNIIRPVNTDDYIKYHKKFMRNLRKCIKETDKKIIVLSHFAPSPQSIAKKYNKGIDISVNASYCSNLEKFIKQNPRIVLWHHGHTHECFDYYVEQCHVICEPYGYCHENKIGHRKYVGKLIEL